MCRLFIALFLVTLYKIPDLLASIKGKFLSAVVCVLKWSKKNGEDVENKPARRRRIETEMARRWREWFTRAESEKMGTQAKY